MKAQVSLLESQKDPETSGGDAGEGAGDAASDGGASPDGGVSADGGAAAGSSVEASGEGGEVPDSLDEAAVSVKDTLFGIWEDFLHHLPLLAAGVLVILCTWLIAFAFNRFSGALLSRFRLRDSLQELLRRLVYMAIWVAGLILAAMVIFPGVTPGKALAALGLGSIAVGLAFKDIFENFFAGILILWRFPFETGDFIGCEGITGKVEDVTIRNTLIRRTTGELVVVPNAVIFKNPVDVLTNWKHRRVTVICGVAYGEDVDESRAVVERAVEGCETVDREQPLQIFAQEFGESSINFEVTWWTGPRPVDIRRSRDEVVAAVKRALDDAGIEIPFPYRTLTFKESLEAVVRSEDGDGRRRVPGDASGKE